MKTVNININNDTYISDSLAKSLVENNQFLKLLLDTIPCPVFYKDKDGIYQHCNDAFSKMILGIPKEMIIGKSLFDIPENIPHELAKIYKEKDDELFKNPGTQNYKNEVLCSDKITRVFNFYKSVLIDDKGESIGLVGVMLDISELKQKKAKLEERNKTLEELSSRDPLTGIYNRRKFDKKFTQMLKIAKRYDYILNFSMIDIDNFKLYNDTFGHQKGDEALKIVSRTIGKKLLRPDDFHFRLGGEEFGVLFFSNDTNSSKNIIENIRSDIENLNIKHVSALKKITISAGLIMIKNIAKNQEYFYREADKLLYKAKEKGKNLILSKII
jgi:diguanylate cyclase (GGDEF)-like protein/PAS domain S-box-containing protein